MPVSKPVKRHRAALRSCALPLAVSGLALALTAPALAQTWDGQVNTSWSNPTNWDPNGVPAANGAVVINNIFAPQPTLNVDSAALNSTTISAGTLSVDRTLTSTTVTLSGTGNMTINASGNVVGNVSQNGTGTLGNNGTITGNLSISGGTVNNAGAVTGTTTVSGNGILNLNAGSNLGNTAALTVNGGTVNVNLAASPNNNETVGTLSGTGGTIDIDSGRSLTTESAISSSYAGSITGAGSLIKSGAGTLTLTGTNALTGPVDVTAGVLAIAGLGTIASTDLETQAGATLRVDGGALLTTAVITNAGTFEVNGPESIARLNNTGTTTLGARLTLNSGTSTLGGTVDGTGGITVLGGTTNVTSALLYSNSTMVAGGTMNVTGAGSLASSSVDVSAGSLNVDAGGLASAAVVGVSGTGTLNVTGANTIAALTQSGGTIQGTGPLTVNGTFNQTGGNMAGTVNVAGAKTLSGGTVSGTLGGTGATTIQTGTTIVTGTISGGNTNINSGTLAVDGGALTSNVKLNGGTISGLSDSTITGFVYTSSAGGTISAATGTTLTFNNLSPTEEGALTIGTAGVAGTVAVIASGSQNEASTIAVDAGTLRIGGAQAGQSLMDFIAGTSISSGATLDIGGFNTTVNALTGAGTVTNSGAAAGLTLIGTSTFDGVIQDGAGATALTISNAVFQPITDVTLTGASTFTGSTTISNGTLNITGSIASQVVTVDAGGTLKVDGAALSDTAAVTLNGTGNLTLTGAERFGSLASSSATSTVTLDGNLMAVGGNNASTTFAGVMSATAGGGIRKEGTGTLTLTGANSIQFVNVVGGTLTAGNANAFGDGVFRIVDGTLDLGGNTITMMDGSVDFGEIANGNLILTDTSSLALRMLGGTVSANVGGAGGLTFNGLSATLSGMNTYTGGTFINGGTLNVTGSIASSAVTVNDGGTLAGTGTAGSTTVKSGGTLAPGASIGTLTIDGDLTLENGSFFLVEVDPDSTLSDLVMVEGTASLGGTLQHVGLDGTYRPFATYTILEAKSVEGTFDDVSSELLFLSPDVEYFSDRVDLTLIRNNLALASIASTDNQAAVANAIDGSIPDLEQASPSYHTLVEELVMVSDEAAFRDYLDQLSGAEYAQHLQSVLWSTRAINRVVTERMECGTAAQTYAQADGSSVMPTADAPMAATGCFEPGQLALWSRGFGSWNSLDGDADAPGYDETQYGILFGADYSFDDSWFLGVAGGYFDSNGDFDGFGGRAGAGIDYDGLQLAAYGGYDDSVLYARGILAYGNYDGKSDREIDGPGGINGRLKGDPSSDVLSFYGETGYRFAIGSAAHITPFAGLSLAGADLDGFTERDPDGTGAALQVHDADASSVASVLGLRFDAAVDMGSGVFVPELALAWSHEFGDTSQDVGMSFADGPPGTDFKVSGSDVARNALLVDAGAKFLLSDSIDIGISYTGWFSTDYTSNAVAARIGVRF